MKKFLFNLGSLVMLIIVFPFVFGIWVCGWIMIGLMTMFPASVVDMGRTEVWKFSKKLEDLYNTMLEVVSRP